MPSDRDSTTAEQAADRVMVALLRERESGVDARQRLVAALDNERHERPSGRMFWLTSGAAVAAACLVVAAVLMWPGSGTPEVGRIVGTVTAGSLENDASPRLGEILKAGADGATLKLWRGGRIELGPHARLKVFFGGYDNARSPSYGVKHHATFVGDLESMAAPTPEVLPLWGRMTLTAPKGSDYEGMMSVIFPQDETRQPNGARLSFISAQLRVTNGAMALEIKDSGGSESFFHDDDWSRVLAPGNYGFADTELLEGEARDFATLAAAFRRRTQRGEGDSEDGWREAARWLELAAAATALGDNELKDQALAEAVHFTGLLPAGP